jgi:hypothetical protein
MQEASVAPRAAAHRAITHRTAESVQSHHEVLSAEAG